MAEKGDRRWYVIHTYSGYENKVKANLEKRIESMNMEEKIFRIVVPEVEEIEIKDGKKKIVKKRIYPGYVLVEMILTDDSWYVVRNTPGVTGFVGTGAKPIPLTDEEVRQIIGYTDADAPRPKVDLSVKDRVRVVTGPFENFEGIVEEIDPQRGKLRVMISMFGRETPVELDFSQVEKI